MRFLKIFKRRSKFYYLGEEINGPALIMSNHVGASGPLSFELFHPVIFRLWGTHEMTGSFKEVYKYLSTTYFHNKKHMPKLIAKIVGGIACPFLHRFYKGLEILPTYHDARLVTSIKKSVESLKAGQPIVIFPENSDNGYFDHLTEFFPGSIMLLELCERNNIDVPVYVSYYNKHNRKHLFSKPVYWKDIKGQFSSREEAAKHFCDLCNELGEISKTIK